MTIRRTYTTLLAKSDARRKRIIRLRSAGLTWTQIGEQFGISRQRAQQIGGKRGTA